MSERPGGGPRDHAWVRRRLPAYVASVLGEADEQAIALHLETCEACRALERDLRTPEFSEESRGGHLPAELIARWDRVAPSLHGLERDAVARHVAGCARCRGAIGMLGYDPDRIAVTAPAPALRVVERRAANALPPGRVKAWWWAGGVSALAAAAALVVAVQQNLLPWVTNPAGPVAVVPHERPAPPRDSSATRDSGATRDTSGPAHAPSPDNRKPVPPNSIAIPDNPVAQRAPAPKPAPGTTTNIRPNEVQAPQNPIVQAQPPLERAPGTNPNVTPTPQNPGAQQAPRPVAETALPEMRLADASSYGLGAGSLGGGFGRSAGRELLLGPTRSGGGADTVLVIDVRPGHDLRVPISAALGAIEEGPVRLRLLDARGVAVAETRTTAKALFPKKFVVVPAAALHLAPGTYSFEVWQTDAAGHLVRFDDRPLFRVRVP